MKTLTLLLVTLLAAQAAEARKPPKPKPDCLDGTYYDDGRFESGLRSSMAEDNFVMLFEAPQYPARVDKVCLSWWRTSFYTSVFFELRVWAADGPDGAPGTLLHAVPVLQASGVGKKPRFYNYELQWANLVVEGPVYVGPFWDPLDAFLIYLAMDAGPGTPRRRGFHGVGLLDDRAPNLELGSSIQQAPSYRAMGVRVKFGPP